MSSARLSLPVAVVACLRPSQVKWQTQCPLPSFLLEVGEGVIYPSLVYVYLGWQFHNTRVQPHKTPLLLATIYSHQTHNFHEVMAALRTTNPIAFFCLALSLSFTSSNLH